MPCCITQHVLARSTEACNYIHYSCQLQDTPLAIDTGDLCGTLTLNCIELMRK